MRTATILAWGQIDWWPENLFRGCCPCICLTLKLLSQLWLVVRDCVFIFSLTKESAKKRRESERWSWLCVPIHTHTHTCFLVCWCALLSECVWVLCVLLLCLRVLERQCEWRGESRESRKGRREMLCANPYSLWRIQGHPFMFCQPAVNQFPIKVVLNSAVIPISSSRSRLAVSGALKQFPCLLSDLL